jgi:hypothetical protein
VALQSVIDLSADCWVAVFAVESADAMYVEIDLAKLLEAVSIAFARALSRLGIKTLASIPMIAITISNSISVNPEFEDGFTGTSMSMQHKGVSEGFPDTPLGCNFAWLDLRNFSTSC